MKWSGFNLTPDDRLLNIIDITHEAAIGSVDKIIM